MVVEVSDRSQVITLVSEDKKEFQISVDAAKGSQHLVHFMEGCDTSAPFPITVVRGAILEKVIDYLNHHRDKKPQEFPKPMPNKTLQEIVSDWDYKFTCQELAIIFELILAANYLDIPGLLDLCCAKVAHEIRGRSVEEIRSIFQIENDFTPEEEKAIREENKWCERDEYI